LLTVLALQGAQHSAQIFSLAMLLSSIFIYNQVGAIDAIAIERLAMVCELAKRIKGRSTVGEVCSLLGRACRHPAARPCLLLIVTANMRSCVGTVCAEQDQPAQSGLRRLLHHALAGSWCWRAPQPRLCCCVSLGADGNNNNSVAAAAGQVDFSPAFIWLLRDFQLRLEANNKPITPAEYLEEALLPIKGGAADIANKNQVLNDCGGPAQAPGNFSVLLLL
jgi:hypothetical protein